MYFYGDVLSKDFYVFGENNIPLSTLVEMQVFHPIFQLIFIDTLRVSPNIDFQELKFYLVPDDLEFFGVSKSVKFKYGEFTEEFISNCINNEVFFDSLKTHSIWHRINSFSNLVIENHDSNLIALSIYIRAIFWRNGLFNDYVLPVSDFDSKDFLVNEIVKSFYSSNQMKIDADKLINDPEFRTIKTHDGTHDVSDGFSKIIDKITSEQKKLVVANGSNVPQDDSGEFFHFEISEKKTTRTVQEKRKKKIQCNVSLKYAGYRDFINKLVLVTFGRIIKQGELDLKTEADQIYKNITITLFDVQAAGFSCQYVSDSWAKNLKKTSSSLIYHDDIYQLFESMSLRFSPRTYDHPKRGNTIHSFRHLNEYEEAIESKFNDFIQSFSLNSYSEINDQNFCDLLWDALKNSKDCQHSKFLIEKNKPQSLVAIKNDCFRLENYLHSRVKGQSEAIRQIVNAEMWSRFKSSKTLRGLFTFLGPSGVGKTYLAKSYAEALNINDMTGYKVLTFNMENYSDERAALALVGAGSHYTDSSAGELTFNVHLYPRTVIVFDEIEKAHPTVIQSLLTLVDTGRLVDATSRVEVDFSQCVIIFTSNLGHEVFDKAKDLGEVDVFDVLRKAKLRNSNMVALSPEFVNRLGAGVAVRFLPLNTRSLLEIAKIQVKVLDLDDDGLIDYRLDSDLAAILLFQQLPQPTARGLKAKQIKLLSEAKELLFSNSEIGDSLDKISKLNISVHPSCFEIQQIGRVLVVGQVEDISDEVRNIFSGYELVQTSAFDSSIVPVSTAKTSAVIIFDNSSSKDTTVQQLSYCSKNFGDLPVFLASNVLKHDEIPDNVWIHSHLGFLEAKLLQFKRIVDVNRRLELAKQKQQGFSYQMKLSEISSDSVTFTVSNPKFNLQISTTRAEEGVTGLLKERPDIRLNQVIGLQRAKTHLQRVIQWLKHPELLASQNIAFPAGVLLAGPPGTGKTLLAKAVAGECELPFISLSVGDLISGIKNGTAENIDRAFKQASDIAPCIMFIDEIDTIATARRAGEISDNNSVNVLLTHLDGIQKRSEPIFVLAATNFPQALDQALLRAGRLDEIIYCDLPDKAARNDFFTQLSAKYSIVMDSHEQAKYVEMTQGMSGAQIDKIFRDYLYRISAEDFCLHTNSHSIFHQNLFREAIINICFGSANPNKVLSNESKIQVAWHEAGHLLTTKLLLPQHAITFATIEPRNQSLGFVSMQRDDAAGPSTASEVKAQIAVAMAGREAERLQNDNYDVTSGAVSDIEIATRYSMHAVCEWGLDPEFGQLSASVLNFQTTSVDLQRLAEQRIRFWLEEGQQKAAQVLLENKKLLQEIARQLLENESLYADEIERFFIKC